ncbi:MAG: glycoside hydrolase family 2 protein [Clostridiales bacterium]|nr:glycoside hydrolase family 2 protein [Clostridiales bacterium]
MRNIKLINKEWRFLKDAKEPPKSLPESGAALDLPYTWNGKDGQDGGNDYYRGKCFFAKELKSTDMPAGDVVYLQLDGVNSSAEVFWNSKSIARHDGGYSTFRVKLGEIKENNLLVISADNSPNEFVYPQQADFTFYGGIYRDVLLVGVPKQHFDLDYYGAPGVMVTPTVNGTGADISAQAFCEGVVTFEIIDNGTVIAVQESAGKNPKVNIKLENVHLWDGVKDPYLYTLRAVLKDGGEELDEVNVRFGIRSFEVDPQRGFVLNGREYPLRGVSRHQDRPEIGNALTVEHHKEDIELICEMGANTIRLAHYQHAQAFYDLCDERGLIVWAEIPYISRHMPQGTDNTVSQMKELVYQNYNHPCIVTWGLSNEITMAGAKDESLLENHKVLNDLVHSIDKTRPTTLAVITMCSPDEEYAHLTDIVSYNHYFGWYGGNVSMYGPWFDKFHKKYPNRAIGISEYGCEALNWHTSAPEQGDYTEEYQAYYHEELIKQISARPWLWATHVWNMFDFAADARSEGGENGMNHKGLVTFDRKYKKDSFYAYKAWLSDEPFVHICSKRYVDRVEDTATVKVYTNQPQVELFVNGESIALQQRGEFPFFTFEIANVGESKIVAKAGEYEDSAVIRKVDTPNEAYVMQSEGDVINWFEIETPAGYYSVNDTLGDIMKSFKGKLALISMIPAVKAALSPKGSGKKDKKKGGGMSLAGFTINKTMIDMAKGFSLKRAFSMAGNLFSKEQIISINKKLNNIKKPKNL